MVEQAETAVTDESQKASSSALPYQQVESDRKPPEKTDNDTGPTSVTSAENRAVAEESEQQPEITYADAVKHHDREATIPEENEPSSPVKAIDLAGRSAVDRQVEVNEDEDENESATLLDKGKGGSRDTSGPGTPTRTNVQLASASKEEPVEQISTPTRPAATPTKSRPTSFPVMPRLPSSTSQRSVQSSPSGASTPSRSTSYPNLAQSTSNSTQGHGHGPGTPQSQGQVTPNDQKGGKARKRLNSIKGFVRRISDQGGGLVRSNSTGRPGSRSGGLASPEVNAGDDGNNQKKRLSMNRSKSGQGGE